MIKGYVARRTAASGAVGAIVLGAVSVIGGVTGASAAPLTATVPVHCKIPVAGAQPYAGVISATVPDSVSPGDSVSLANFQISITLNVATTNALLALGATTLQGTVTAGSAVTNTTPSALSITATVPTTAVPQQQNASGDGIPFTIVASGLSPSAVVNADATGTVQLNATTVSAVFDPKDATGTSVLPPKSQIIPCTYDSPNPLIGSVPIVAAATPTPSPTTAPTPDPNATPTPTPDPNATPKPTPVATATPTPKPTATATPKPTATPTPAPATPVPTATPTPVPTPEVRATDASGLTIASGTILTTNQSIIVKLSGGAPNASTTVTLFSTPQLLGTTTTDATGSISYPFKVPSSLAPGSHRLVFVGAGVSSEFDFQVAQTLSGIDPLTITQLPVTTASSPTLAATGSDQRPMIWAGTLLLSFGALMVFYARRRSVIAAR